jgi:hypothetical protein
VLELWSCEVRTEIPQLQVVTAIADTDNEDFVSQLLFSQGWSIIFRAIDTNSLTDFIITRGGILRTVIIYQSDLPGFEIGIFDTLTSATSTIICVDKIPMNSHLLMTHIRSQLRLPLLINSTPSDNTSEGKNTSRSVFGMNGGVKGPTPKQAKVIALSGTSGAPGRSCIAFNIASQLTSSGSVELVDADFRAPALSYFIGRSDLPNQSLKLRELIGGMNQERFIPTENTDFTVVDLGALPPLGDVVNDRRWQATLINSVLEETTSLIYLCKSSGLSLIRLEAFMNQFPILLREIPIIYLLNQAGNSREDRALGKAFQTLTKGEVNFTIPSDQHSRNGFNPANKRGNSFTKEIGKIVAELG